MGFFSNIFGSRNYTNINNEELQSIIKNNKNALILDVRTIGEFRSGHIPNAKNIPVHELNTQINNLDAYKNDDIIVYCASGGRSSSAANILNKNGFNKVYNLGGIGKYKGKLT
ncbi:rhodanese-like domain-containing protein [Romboutsia sp. 1001713B170207_170306_H8]|uniref:rhodanese-like domain-containing protein n=1 Tax=Romboutsia sp. 1001713B170207_170306_H8 TaxID=2787112 RepID=UPI0008202F6C|nr:rhodanese-like domain-containing protein [Romboutsia sp. 1001713B170207_170306_H8]SCH49353.1 Thiosulfate sulfurtransferase PspE precursor [uncultured Clostridium sp.]